ncbi:MAG: C40 family peptidase, partial [Rubrivivax sp.]|nr:C40 family peptidase [Rubrivivax sp.]
RRTAAPVPPLDPAAAAQVVITAMAFIDTPYQRGGNGGGDDEPADGFDCSGFTRHVYARSLGLALPRTAWDQARAPALGEVGAAHLLPGDLVFFNTLRRAHSHVGIYIGEGRFIHAPRPGARVRVEEMHGTAGRYWVQRFDGARRALPAALR